MGCVVPLFNNEQIAQTLNDIFRLQSWWWWGCGVGDKMETPPPLPTKQNDKKLSKKMPAMIDYQEKVLIFVDLMKTS